MRVATLPTPDLYVWRKRILSLVVWCWPTVVCENGMMISSSTWDVRFMPFFKDLRFQTNILTIKNIQTFAVVVFVYLGQSAPRKLKGLEYHLRTSAPHDNLFSEGPKNEICKELLLRICKYQENVTLDSSIVIFYHSTISI